MKRVKLVSGGIDSYIMSQEYEGENVYIDFGQPYSEEERAALDRLGVDYETIVISKPGAAFGNIYIPDRNLALACIAEMYYGADEIYMAGLKDDNCADKTEAEFEIMSATVSRYAGKQARIISPYWSKTKGDIIAEFRGDKQKLTDTFSCYKPHDGKPCGDCPACLRRVIALETNGIDSGISLSDRIIDEYLRKIHTYDADRISRFFIYLKRRKKPVLAVDIDGILCEDKGGVYYSDREKINADLSEFSGCYIVLYTARLERDRKATEKWLNENNIKYDALIMNKLPYSLIIDDKAKGGI